MRGKLVIISAFFLGLIYSQSFDCKPSKMLKKTSASITKARFDINNISTYIWNNGDMDIMPSGSSGFEFPKYNGKQQTLFLETGVVWGAIVGDSIKVGGSTYRQGLKPGKILDGGTAENPGSDAVRVFRVRPDYATADLSNEIGSGEGSEADIRSQYEKDWNEWPADKGAPYDDINSDGQYDPAIDIPGVIGTDQTLWFVANDLDVETCKYLYGSTPMGVEMQATFWGYNLPEPYGNVIYSKYIIANKSQQTFENMYVGYWLDPDLGGISDDFQGVDTTLDMHFTYNKDNDDALYSTPPAAGVMLLKGPENNSGNEIGLTGFIPYICGGPEPFQDPPMGFYEGTLEMYSHFTDSWEYDDTTNGDYYNTRIAMAGNPFTNEGWTAEKFIGCGSIGTMSFGSFDLAPGEQTEVVFAKFASMGTDRMNSLELLKDYGYQIKEAYQNNIDIKSLSSPPSPEITGISDDDMSVVVTWQANTEIESFNQNGYEFQGYNLYQLTDDFPFPTAGNKIATFDLADGITEISGMDYDGETDRLVTKVLQNGTDSGLKYEFEITKDYSTGGNIIKGKNYYYAVTAYTYNSSQTALRKTSESAAKTSTINYHGDLPGPNYQDIISVNQIRGEGLANINIVVENPEALTGHKYQIRFSPIDSVSVNWSVQDINSGNYIFENKIAVQYGNEEYFADGLKLYVQIIPFSEREIFAAYNNGTKLSNRLSVIIGQRSDGDRFEFWTTTWSYKQDYPQNYGSIINDDFELRFTGEKEPNYETDFLIKDGTGSIGTGVSGLSESTINSTRSKIRIPFEAWNLRTNEQINVIVKHKYEYGDSPTENNRYYLINTPYSENLIDVMDAITTQSNRLLMPYYFYWETGDKLILEYGACVSDDVFEFSTTSLTGLTDPEIPEEYLLEQNYPNPFNPSTVIKYSLPENGLVKLELFNLLGQKVSTLVNAEQVAGYYQQRVDMSKYSSGVYFYRINVNGNFVETKKMMLLK